MISLFLLACSGSIEPIRILDNDGVCPDGAIDVYNGTPFILDGIEFTVGHQPIADGDFEVDSGALVRVVIPNGATDLYVYSDDLEWQFSDFSLPAQVIEQ